MKALTLHQPWASLIMLKHKTLETRHWTTRYRGKLAIHAGKKWDRTLKAHTRALIESYPILEDFPSRVPLGCILGVVELKGIYHAEAIRDKVPFMDTILGDLSDGRTAWDVKVLEVYNPPIPAKGQQGLWEWDGQPVGDLIYGSLI